jgi:hypothetical protein
VFKQLVAELELETNQQVVFVRSDNGPSEFGIEFQTYLIGKAIHFELSPAYKHSLNGVIERLMGTINKIARSMMYHARAPHTLWCFATEHAVYLRNRLPTAALPWGESTAETPYEAFFNRKPNLSSLRTWGCAAYVLFPADKEMKLPEGVTKRKWEPKIKKERIFVGLRGNKLWKFLDPETLKEEVSVDVEFHEFKFPSVAERAKKGKGCGKSP